MVNITVDQQVPTLVLTPNTDIGISLAGENTKFNITTPPLTVDYKLQFSVNGEQWYNTPYSFGPGSKFKQVSYDLTGFGSLQFRLNP